MVSSIGDELCPVAMELLFLDGCTIAFVVLGVVLGLFGLFLFPHVW